MDKLALFINTAMLAMFVENAIFSRALGTSVAFYASRKKESIFGLGLGITYVIVVSSCITFFIDGWLADWQYFYVVMPLIYTLTVSIVYTGSLLLLWRFLPKIFRNIKKYVHLSVFNAAVLGALTGAIITERVYVVPGIGNLLTEAINKYDNGVIVGGTLFYAILTVTSLILGDVLMAMVDPRISFSTKDR